MHFACSVNVTKIIFFKAKHSWSISFHENKFWLCLRAWYKDGHMISKFISLMMVSDRWLFVVVKCNLSNKDYYLSSECFKTDLEFCTCLAHWILWYFNWSLWYNECVSMSELIITKKLITNIVKGTFLFFYMFCTCLSFLIL